MKFFEPTGLILILVIVLIIFGPSQLPKLAKAFGKSAKALRDGADGKYDEEDGAPPKPGDKGDAAASAEAPAKEAPKDDAGDKA